jgi:hypothetical protein
MAADAMRSLGAWGAEQAPPKEADAGVQWAEVDYFGEKFAVLADPLSMEFVLEEFMDMAAQIDLADEDPRAVGVVRQFLRAMIKPSDFARFWTAVKTNRQDVVAQMEFGKWLIGEATGHPTEQPSDSSPGVLLTLPKSEDDSFSRVQRRLESQGRPDLALAVLKHREYEESKTG